MAAFESKEYDVRRDYDLAPHGPKGRIKSPTLSEVRKFRDHILSVYQDVSGESIPEHIDGIDDDESIMGEFERMSVVVARLPRLKQDETFDQVLEAVIELCAGTPSRDEITNLPADVQNAFAWWVVGLFRPLF